MLIGVDASRANKQQRTGVEWYSYHILRELAALPQAAEHRWRAYTPTPLLEDMRAAIPLWEERRLAWPPKYLWTQLRLSYELYRHEPGLLFVPAHVLPRIRPRKTCVTVHDIGFHRMPELYKPIQVAYHEIATRDIVRSNAKILTVSEFSKQEIMDAYHVSAERIHVTPLGVEEEYQPQSLAEQARVRERHALGDRPFVLYIGRLEEKKNIHRLVEAFLLMAEQRSEVLCVLAGPRGRGWENIRELLRKHPQGKRVRVAGYVDERDKRALLSAAQCYVQPSLYEGFGLPILEAMACGTLVVSSSAGSLPEVGGSCVAEYVDPRAASSIARGMERAFAYSDAERNRLIQQGRAHAATFTWKKTAEQTMTAFMSYV